MVIDGNGLEAPSLRPSNAFENFDSLCLPRSASTPLMRRQVNLPWCTTRRRQPRPEARRKRPIPHDRHMLRPCPDEGVRQPKGSVMARSFPEIPEYADDQPGLEIVGLDGSQRDWKAPGGARPAVSAHDRPMIACDSARVPQREKMHVALRTRRLDREGRDGDPLLERRGGERWAEFARLVQRRHVAIGPPS